MSVTFFIDGNPTGWYTAVCYPRYDGTQVEVVRADSWSVANDLCDEHVMTCTSCATSGIYVREEMDVSDEFDVNLANTNATMMLSVLGIEADDYDLAGAMAGSDFLGRVLMALAEDRDDSGVSDVVEKSDGHATMIYCGLPAGYWTERLNDLHDLAREAAKLGRDVIWG
jgi:hypothetical protein